VRAALLTELPSHGLHVRDDVPEPDALPGSVLIEVDACGICGTDLDILGGRSYSPDLPFVLGHEPVGRVVEVGAGVGTRWLGRRVSMTIFIGHEERCEVCREHPDWLTPCRTDSERLCYPGAQVVGVLGRPGGFADRLSVPERLLVEIPEQLDTLDAACLVDAGATAANAAQQVPAYDPRALIVLGAGPLGLLAAQLLPRPPLVVEPLENRRIQAEQLGLATASSLDAVSEPPGAILDCAGAAGLLDSSLKLLGPRGTYVAAGYGPVTTDSAHLARKELTVRGVRSGRREDLEWVFEGCATGALKPPPVSVWPLEQIDDAFAALKEGVVAGKAVIDLTKSRGTA
jgi:D-arabinose 1-dehydrogenase-like Zn-dependent alcohol dehydrogenase